MFFCVFACLYLSLVPSFGDRIEIELIQIAIIAGGVLFL